MVSLSKRERAIFIGGVILLLLLIYGRSLGNDFVFWDDTSLVIDNPISRGISFKNIFDAFSHYDPDLYVPFTFLTFQINYYIAGLHPFIYHLTNLLLHAASSILVGWIILQMTGRKSVAAVIAALFAVHPINVEAVAWVSARKDVLSAFFFLFSLGAYLRSKSGSRARWYWLSVSMFLLGLLSKASILTLPFILVLADWYRTKTVTLRQSAAACSRVIEESSSFRGRAQGEARGIAPACFTKASLTRAMPYLFLGVIFGVVAMFGKPENTLTIAENFLIGMKAAAFTLLHLIWPSGYSVIYPFEGETSFMRPDLIIPTGGIIAICVLTVIFMRRFPSVFLGWWWFLIMLVPSFLTTEKGSDLVPDIYLTSDRYAYLAAIGVFFVVAKAADIIHRTNGRIVVPAAAVLIACFSILSFFQSGVWKNTETLFRRALAHNPESAVAHNNLGVFYDANGAADAAFREYEDAVRAGGTGDAWFNYGMALAKRSRTSDAITALAKAVALRPNYAIAHQNLGALLLDSGEIQAAVDHLLVAQSLDSRNVAIFLNLGMALEKGGDLTDARRAYERALQLDPVNVFAKERMGKIQD